jgi:hypothetical protein
MGGRWLETPLVEQMKKIIQNPAESVGTLKVTD